MTDYTKADQITAKWDAVRPKFAGAFHADTYALRRDVPTSDGMGGTTMAEGTVESGRCSLDLPLAQGNESLSGDAITARYRIAAELPKDTIAKPTDVLVVNGNRYQIVVVKRGGEHELFPVAELEAMS